MDTNLTRASLLGMLLIVVAVFWPTLQQLHLRWVQMDGTYAYGYFLLALVAVSVNKNIRLSRGLRGQPVWAALPLGLIASSVWFVGHLTQTQLLEQLALPAVLWSWILVYFGWPLARALLPCVFLLYLAVPLWDMLIYPLRVITVVVVQWWIGLVGIPVYIDGFTIEVPAGAFIIAGGCSGLNTLLMGVVISSFYAAQYLRSYQRLVCVGTMVVLALIGNWVRVFLLVLIGYYSDMQNPIVYDHLMFGWVIFIVCLFAFFFLLRFIDVGEVAGSKNVPEKPEPGPSRYATGALLIALVLSISLPVWARVAGGFAASAATGMALESNSGFGRIERQQWLPAYQGYDVVQQWAGDIADIPVFITAMTYLQQRQGKELVYFSNSLAEEGRQRNLSPVQLPNGSKMGRSVIFENGDSFLVLWTYRVGARDTLSAFNAKMLQVLALFAGESAASLIAVAVKCPRAQCQSRVALVDNDDFILALTSTISTINWGYNSQD